MRTIKKTKKINVRTLLLCVVIVFTMLSGAIIVNTLVSSYQIEKL